jgi:hypothetical protein
MVYLIHRFVNRNALVYNNLQIIRLGKTHDVLRHIDRLFGEMLLRHIETELTCHSWAHLPTATYPGVVLQIDYLA